MSNSNQVWVSRDADNNITGVFSSPAGVPEQVKASDIYDANDSVITDYIAAHNAELEGE